MSIGRRRVSSSADQIVRLRPSGRPCAISTIRAVVKASFRQFSDVAPQRVSTVVFICFPTHHLHPSLEISRIGQLLKAQGGGVSLVLTCWTERQLPISTCLGRHGRRSQMDFVFWLVMMSAISVASRTKFMELSLLRSC